MKRLPVALLVIAAMSLASCTGLQGGSEPHDDGSSGSAPSLASLPSASPTPSERQPTSPG
jgi:hypothetical protein